MEDATAALEACLELLAKVLQAAFRDVLGGMARVEACLAAGDRAGAARGCGEVLCGVESLRLTIAIMCNARSEGEPASGPAPEGEVCSVAAAGGCFLRAEAGEAGVADTEARQCLLRGAGATSHLPLAIAAVHDIQLVQWLRWGRLLAEAVSEMESRQLA